MQSQGHAFFMTAFVVRSELLLAVERFVLKKIELYGSPHTVRDTNLTAQMQYGLL